MIADNPIHTQNGLGAAQDDPASSGSGSWLGRTIKVLKGVACLVSGVAAFAALASGSYALAAVLGVVFAVSGLSMLFGSSNNAEELSGDSSQSPPDNRDDPDAVHLYRAATSDFVTPASIRDTSTHHSPGHHRPDPVTKMRSAIVDASPDNGLRLPPHKLVGCQLSLNSGLRAVSGALQQMLMHSSMPRCSSILIRRNLDTLKTKEPFDEQIFLETAELLRVDQSTINDHQRIDKSEKIALLEREYKQLKEVPEVQRKQALSLMADFKTIEQNLESYSQGARLSFLPDPVPENEITTMKDHVDALDALLSRIGKSALNQLIQADDELQDKMSEAAEAVQKCKNIFEYRCD